MDPNAVFPIPTAQETEALIVASGYLARTASALGTRRSSPILPLGDDLMLSELRRQAMAAAALCVCMLETSGATDLRKN